MNKKLILIGASGHGKVVADIAKKNGYTEIAFLDDNETIKYCLGYPVVGKTDDIKKYAEWDFFVSVGNTDVRQKMQEQLERACLSVVTLIHPAAVVADDVKIGSGSVIMAGAVINPGTQIGRGCIVNTCASVDHDCIISDYVHVSVGSHVAGNVRIGNRTWIGAGATVINNIDIIEDCIIGAGAVVTKHIVCKGTYKGIPARIDS